MTLFRTALGAFRWSLVAELASHGMTMLVLLVLARLLVPSEFGVLAAATVIVAFAQILVEAGLDKALIQRRQRIDECASMAFSLNMVLGLVAAGLLVLAAPSIGEFFHDGRVTGVVRVLALQLPLAALSTVHTALLRRSLDFRTLFWVRLATTAAGAAASIPLALLGAGYWALVAGTLLGQAMQAVALWWRNPWRPVFAFDGQLFRELTRFGGWALLSGLLGWSHAWMDAIVVGRHLGSSDLGLYRTGMTLVVMAFGLIFSPMMPVLFSSFSRAQEEPALLRAAFETVTRAIALVSVPLGVYFVIVSEPLSSIVFGVAWAGIAMVVAAMGLREGMAWVVGANAELYRATGKPHVDTWLNAALLAVSLVGYVISIRFGLRTFLATRLCLTAAAILAHVIVARMTLGVPLRSWLRPASLVVPVVAGLVALQIDIGSLHPVTGLLIRSAVFAAIVGPMVLYLERTYVRELIRLSRATMPAREQ